VLVLLPSQAMAVLDWIPSKVMQGHLQNLTKQGFMMATKLTTCCVPEDPAFSVHAKGYVVSFVAFYEWGFNKPSHSFLCSLL
jgi:hypothetical protein